MNDFVVYAHFTGNTNRLFYIGEGKPNRAVDIFNRNSHWNKIVKKHGFRAIILRKNLTKLEAEEIETKLIKKAKHNLGKRLANYSIGPICRRGNNWIPNAPKEMHPMFGRKNPNPKLAEYNRKHFGILSNTYGLKREDLSLRNKTNNPSPKREVICIETGILYPSLYQAALSMGRTNTTLIWSVANGYKKSAYGFTWKYK